MSAPLLTLTGCCWGKVPAPKTGNDCKLSHTGDRLLIALPVTDALVSITCLIIGILGASGVIAMPAAAAYALIGVSGGITLLWIAMFATIKLCPQIIPGFKK